MPSFEKTVKADLSPGDEFVFADGSHPAFVGKVDKVIAYFSDKGTQVLYQSTAGQYHHADKVAPIPNDAKEKSREERVAPRQGSRRAREESGPKEIRQPKAAPAQSKSSPVKAAQKVSPQKTGARKQSAPTKKASGKKAAPTRGAKGKKARR